MAMDKGAFLVLFCICSLIDCYNAAQCTSDLSVQAGCNDCTDWGQCVEGTVPVSDWLKFALKTQRELQVDFTFDQFIMLDSHNSFQARSYGIRYGANDTCVWPPPYGPENCTSIGNHEFTIIDQLNMGIRGIEIDNWYCYGDMRIAHLGRHEYLGVCEADHMLYSDLVRGIGQWLDQPENQGEIIRIYLNEKDNQGYDEIVNGVFEDAFGDRILSPSDFNNTYGRVWPTIRQMREDGKNVLIIASASDGVYFTHGDVYIFPLPQIFDIELRINQFTPYPDCGGRTDTNFVRVYSDTLNFPLIEGGYYSGEETVGSIKDLTEYTKCRVQNPGMDMINPELVETGIFTWAEGQPEAELTYDSCIMLDGTDHRWYASADCSQSLFYACQSESDPESWRVSAEAGPYTTTGDVCPSGYSFSVPHNGYRQQKLIESSGTNHVWLNFSQWLPDAPTASPTTTPTGAAHRLLPSLSQLAAVVLSAVISSF